MNESRDILQYLHYHPLSSRGDITAGTAFKGSDATLKRVIAAGIKAGDIVVEGKARATRYRLSPQAQLLMPLNLDTYFALEVDERQVQSSYNFELINGLLTETRLFSDKEQAHLDALQDEFRQHVNELTDNEFRKEMERLGIDLSWKSSQIEGNTYTLLETERLLQLLTKDLSIDKGLRRHRVGITGTNYHPLDNEFQIREAMRGACKLINSKYNIFEKALLTLLLLSYIQPFLDGNKRTARITSNAILIANDYCPLSFRSIDSIYYKKAMLIFYEQNNLYAFKQIFIEQFEFAVKEYF